MRTPAKRPQDSTGELSLRPDSDAGLSPGTHAAPAAAPRPGISRRMAVGAMMASIVPVAGVAANVPAIASSDQHPDGELLELGRRYDRLHVATEAALRHLEDRQEAYDDQERCPRDVLRHRLEDHIGGLNMPMLPSTRCVTADPEHSAVYSEDEISLLKHVPPPSDPELIPAQQARAEEIAREWQRWTEECAGLRDTTGFSAAQATLDKLDDEHQLVIEQIAAAPAATFSGLWVKARILQHIYDELPLNDVGYNDNHHDLVRGLIRDLAALVGGTA